MNTCRTCGTEIPPTGKRGRPAAYCSAECRPEPGTRPTTSTDRPEPIKVCTCETCGTEFNRPGTRGRLPKVCPSCREAARPDAGATVETAPVALANFDTETMRKGDLVKLVSDDEMGTYKVMSTDLGKDGSVMLYGGRNYGRKSQDGRTRIDCHAQYRSVLPCDVLGIVGHDV